jgi:hypothetical protein
MAGTNRLRKVSMLPRMVKMIILVVATGMPDPSAAVGIDVRSGGMAGAIRLTARGRSGVGARAVLRDIPAADFRTSRRRMAFGALRVAGKGADGKSNSCRSDSCEGADESLHGSSRS